MSFTDKHEDALAGLSTVWLASGAAITVGGMMVHLQRKFGSLQADGSATYTLTGSGTAQNGALTGSYGDGILGVAIASIVLNGILFVMLMSKWMRASKDNLEGMVKASFTMVGLAVMMGVAGSAYDLYIQHNFGNKIVNGKFGTDCSTTSCDKLKGTEGSAILGVNITMIVLGGLAVLFHTGVVANKMNWLTGLVSRSSRRRSR